MRVALVHRGREHLGLETLSSVLQAAGHEVRLAHDPDFLGVDDNVLHLPRAAAWFAQDDAVVAKIRAFRPDVVAFSCYTSTFAWCLRILEPVRAFFAGPVVFGGIHVTLVPEVVERQPAITYGVRGEGEIALPALLRALEGQGRIEETPGLIWRSERGLTLNPLAPLVELDSLPPPDKGMFAADVDLRRDYLILTSRGCPHRCTYCTERNLKDLYGAGYFRRRSVAHVLAELTAMRDRWRGRSVMFADAVFTIDDAWLREFLPAYKQRIGLPFRCLGHVRFVDEAMARALKDAGCRNIEFGVQTTNEEVRAAALDRRDTNETHLQAFAACDRAGLSYDVTHMTGLPGEQEADFAQAAAMYARLKRLNRVKVFSLMYFPRMAIGDLARAQGLITETDQRGFERGEGTGNYFHFDAVKDERARAMHRRYGRLFKLLPLLSPATVDWLLRRPGAMRLVGGLPGPAVIALQSLAAVRGGDRRFLVVFGYTLRRLGRALRAKARAISGDGI